MEFQNSVINNSWWEKTTIYQIYIRSFFDSNEDGIGDLNGVKAKLSYLKKLGIETILLSPIFKSPHLDYGFDIQDYKTISTEYGSINDFERLVDEIHKKRMKIVLDIAINHTSKDHPWFIDSLKSKNSNKRDWYIWYNGKQPNGKEPPNNWRSIYGGSGWHYSKLTQQWYWSYFMPFQPDLNYRNSEVKKAIFNILRFWLNKGVDGFRFDIINSLFKDSEIRDNPFVWKFLQSDTDSDELFQSCKYNLNRPETFTFLKELSSVINEYHNPQRIIFSGINGSAALLKKYSYPNLLTFTYNMKASNSNFDKNSYKSLIENKEENDFVTACLFSDHLKTRKISKLGNEIKKAKLNAMFHLTSKSIPIIYYGEEIGIKQHTLPLKESHDPLVSKYKHIPIVMFNIIGKLINETVNRDECRTPMQWDDTPNSGFCPSYTKSWLPITTSYKMRNVMVQEENPDSLLNCYKKMLFIRNKYTALQTGSLKILDESFNSKDVLLYERKSNINNDLQVLYIVLNFSNKCVHLDYPDEDVKFLASTIYKSEPLKYNKIILNAFEGILLIRFTDF